MILDADSHFILGANGEHAMCFPTSVYMTCFCDAQNRNAQRARKLPPEIVEKDWKRSQQNLKMMQGIFGKDLMIITNDYHFLLGLR